MQIRCMQKCRCWQQHQLLTVADVASTDTGCQTGLRTKYPPSKYPTAHSLLMYEMNKQLWEWVIRLIGIHM